MAKTHERIFALVAAFIFLGTTVAITAVIILQIRQQNKADQANQEGTSQQDLNNQSQPQEGKLKGTQLEGFIPIEQPVETLQSTDLKVGTGDEVKAGDTITADYTGAYAVNGIIFESSKDSGEPATFPLSNVIQGWQQGVPGMKVGGIRRLVIPGALAYGEAPAGYVPNSAERPMGTLVFDIELVKVGQ